MSASEQSQTRTRMFARVLGPYLTIVPTTVAVRGAYMQELLRRSSRQIPCGRGFMGPFC